MGCRHNWQPSYTRRDWVCTKCGRHREPFKRRRSGSGKKVAAIAGVACAFILVLFVSGSVDVKHLVGVATDGLENVADGVVSLNPDMATDIAQRVAAEADRIAEETEEVAKRIAEEEAEVKRIAEQEAAERIAQERAAWSAKVSIIEDTIYELTNQHRLAAGLQPLMRDAKIDSIARSHSQDMVDRNYFGHDTPEGWGPTDRGNAAGYPCRKDYGSYYTYGLAENIHGITHHYVGSDAAQIGHTLVDGQGRQGGWMDSSGHRANILDTQWDRIGVGVAVDHDNAHNDGLYIIATQNFC